MLTPTHIRISVTSPTLQGTASCIAGRCFTVSLRGLAITHLTELMTGLLKDESGQDLIEYALITSLIALAAVAATGLLATRVGSVFTAIGTKLTTAV